MAALSLPRFLLWSCSGYCTTLLAGILRSAYHSLSSESALDRSRFVSDEGDSFQRNFGCTDRCPLISHPKKIDRKSLRTHQGQGVYRDVIEKTVTLTSSLFERVISFRLSSARSLVKALSAPLPYHQCIWMWTVYGRKDQKRQQSTFLRKRIGLPLFDYWEFF